VLQQKYLDKFSFLADLDIKAGKITEHIGGGSKVLTYIIVTFLIVLVFRNATQYFQNNISYSYKDGVLFGIVFFISIIMMSITTYSEFLYFNF
jgi:hypothetical protein